MSEIVDHRAELQTGDVTTRAAAARELARTGTWDDLELLVELAKSDKSPSLRLYTAAAASDIVARLRGAAGQARMTREQAEQVQNWVKSFDPGNNPSLLMMLSAVADQASIKRLGRMLRDPRNGVRSGAATALRRMAVSAAATDSEGLSKAVGEWLRSKKLPPDAILELLKLAGEVGWNDLGEELRSAAGAGRPHMPAFEEVLQRQAARLDPQTWSGLWGSDGADALCVPLTEGIEDWIVIDDGQAWRRGAKVAKVSIDGSAKIGRVPYRLIWTSRAGESGTYLAIQGKGKTYYRLEGKALTGAVDDLCDELNTAGLAIAGWLADVEGALAVRGRAIALWAGGDLDGSFDILSTLTSHKRPRMDLFYWLGRVKADKKDKKGALAALETFLEKAGKRAVLRPAAEALRDELS